MKPKIYILGAGAIGRALAVFLKLQHKDVVLVRTSSSDNWVVETITVQSGEELLQSRIDVYPLSNIETLEGLIVVTSKSFANASIAEQLRDKSIHSPVVILQNGLDVEQPFLDLDFRHIYRCILFATSQFISEDTIRFKPVAVSPVGIVRGDDAVLRETVEAINNSHLAFEPIKNIHSVVWRKTIANCVFNSICPLLDVDNGLFVRNEEAKLLALQVIRECIAVGREAGVNLNENEVLDTVLLISRSSDGQLISTLQDIKRGRKTEIESLNFAIAKVAANVGKPELSATTMLLGELTRLKSQLALGVKTDLLNA